MVRGRKNVLVVVAVIAYLAAVVSVVVGDVATPRPKWTQVQMKSEAVVITLGESRVQVVATFNMYNHGDAATVKMGYPLGVFEEKLNDFEVTVDERPVKEVKTQAGSSKPSGPMRYGRGGKSGTEAYRFQGPYKQWKTFDVPMGAKAAKTVKVSYWVKPAEVFLKPNAPPALFYSYTLKTGATWKGAIEKAVITLKLDGVTADRIVRCAPNGYQKSADGRTLTWTMKDFKPTADIEVVYGPAKVARAAGQ